MSEVYVPSSAYAAVAGELIESAKWNAQIAEIAAEMNLRWPVSSWTQATLPTAGNRGRIGILTDGLRGLWFDTGSQWASVTGVANVMHFAGIDPTGATDSTAALQAAHDGLPSAGGIIIIPSGTYDFSSSLVFTKPIILIGDGIDVTILEMTSNASLRHGIDTDYSLFIRDLTLTTTSAAPESYGMKAINLQAPASSGQVLIAQRVKIRNWNTGIYVDGGIKTQAQVDAGGATTWNVDRVHLTDVDIQVNATGAAGGQTGCVRCHGVKDFVIDGASMLDNNGTGDHCIYAIANLRNEIEPSVVCKNTYAADPSAMCGVKMVTQTSETIALDVWHSAAQCTNIGIGCNVLLTGAATLKTLELNGSIVDSNTPSTSEGAINLSLADTSVLESAFLRHLFIDDVQTRIARFATAAGATIRDVYITDSFFRAWGKAGGSLNGIVGNSSATGTKTSIVIDRVTADGGTIGGALIPSDGTQFARERIGRIREANTASSTVVKVDDVSDVTFRSAAIQTTDATATTIRSEPLDDATVYQLTARVIGVKSDGTQRASYVRRATIYRTGGGAATQQGATADVYTEESDAAWDCAINVSSNSARVRVTGVAGTTINWRMVLEIQALPEAG